MNELRLLFNELKDSFNKLRILPYAEDAMKDTTIMKEKLFLSRYACLSSDTKGRKLPEGPCVMRTEFQRDRDRIIHSKAFRRLKNKTQVFVAPQGDHFRTRLTHTLDVAQIARSIARALNLNEDLTEAIALAHDLGHTPYGHMGEDALSELTDGKFRHNEQSVRVLEVIEKDGQGLNLTFEVLDGVLNHRSDGHPSTLEGKAVMFADKIAYINHDIDDAIRAGLITRNDLPKVESEILGDTATKRINTMITALVGQSLDKPVLEMEAEVFAAMKSMRSYLFRNVYGPNGGNRDRIKVKRLLGYLFEYFVSHIDEMPDEYRRLAEIWGAETAVCDYISGMTDNYASALFLNLTVPRSGDKF